MGSETLAHEWCWGSDSRHHACECRPSYCCTVPELSADTERFCSLSLGEVIKHFSNFLEIHGLYVGGCVWKYAAVTLLLWVYANLHPSLLLARMKASKVFALHAAKPDLISGTPM